MGSLVTPTGATAPSAGASHSPTVGADTIQMPPPASTTGHMRKRKRGETQHRSPDANGQQANLSLVLSEQSLASRTPVTDVVPTPILLQHPGVPMASTAPTPGLADTQQAQTQMQPIVVDVASGSTSCSEEDEDEDEKLSMSSSSSDKEGEAPAAPVHLKLFKLGELCCDAVARFVRGSVQPKPFADKFNIDQRVKLDHCKRHVQMANEFMTVWRFSASGWRGKAALNALRDYFVAKQRVGLVQTPSYAVYFVPPDAKYLEALGLPESGYALGLQVPLAEGGQKVSK